jgi:acyl-CoA reductase-like NAD-dependent aldehyde dehydrogenase
MLSPHRLPSLAYPSLEDASVPTRLAHELERIHDDVRSAASSELGYAPNDVELLLNDARTFLAHLPEMLEGAFALSPPRRSEEAIREGMSQFSALAPWGRVLLCLPANATVPLALILPAALALVGNEVTVVPSRRCPRTSTLLLDAVARTLPGAVQVMRASTGTAIQDASRERRVDLIYYIGGSKHYAEVAATCAASGVQLIYEGAGGGVLVVDGSCGDKLIAQAARDLVEAKRFCLGRMCTAPNVVLVSAVLREKFLRCFTAAARKGPLPHPWSNISAAAVSRIEDLVREGARAYPEPPSPNGTPCPLLIEATAAVCEQEEEFFAPAALLNFYDDASWAAAFVRRYPARLQVTVFSEKPGQAEALVANTSYARYCFNKNPVEQDPRLPWGGYGRSGNSAATNFVMKGLRSVTIERGAEGPL